MRNISRSFPFSHPTNNPLQYHFYISPTRYLTFYIPVILFRKKIFSNVHDWRDRPAAQLDTNKTVICFSIKLWCRRRGFFLFFLLIDEILISHSLLKVFRTKSASVLNMRPKYVTSSRSTISCNRWNWHSVQSKKYLNTCPSSNRLRTKDGLHRIIVLDIHSVSFRSVWSKVPSYQTEVDYFYKD